MCSDFKSKLADRWLSKNRFQLAEASLAVGFLQHEYEKGVVGRHLWLHYCLDQVKSPERLQTDCDSVREAYVSKISWKI